MFQYVPHLFSSDPSAQSFSPSHRKVSGTQRVLLSQRWWQPSISLEQSSSSERSWQSYWPSHTLADGMHRLPWEHWNSSGTEKKNLNYGEQKLFSFGHGCTFNPDKPALHWAAHPSSSDPSWQSFSPSQTWLYRTQSSPSLQSLKPLRHFRGFGLGSKASQTKYDFFFKKVEFARHRNLTWFLAVHYGQIKTKQLASLKSPEIAGVANIKQMNPEIW